VTLLLAGIALLALVEVGVNVVLRPQLGPPALAAVFEPHLLVIGAVCGALAILLTLGDRSPTGNRIRVIGIAVIVVALVRVGGEWWSPGGGTLTDPAEGITRVTVMTWNLETGTKAPDDVVDGILSVRRPLRPQIVALQELTPDVAAGLEASPDIDERFPYRILQPRDGVLGMGLLSSLPLVEGTSGMYPMFLTAAVLLPDGGRIDVGNAHPLPPGIWRPVLGIPIGLDTRQRDLNLTYVRSALERAAGDETRIVLVGDLNTSPLEPGFGNAAQGLRDVHADVATGTGFTWRPGFVEALGQALLRIDHVLAGSAVMPVAIVEDCSLPGDHCRVTAVIDVPAEEAAAGEAAPSGEAP
jgi:endonuclease/exonuclease/phosphatase (EEP) superfamily protein YafD